MNFFRIVIFAYDIDGKYAGHKTSMSNSKSLDNAKDDARILWRSVGDSLPSWKQLFILDDKTSKTLFYSDNFNPKQQKQA